MQLPIIFNDRYQLNKRLGEGGLAEVYLAQDLALGRLVAVKLLRTQYTHDPTFLVRFHREAQNAASLNSSSVVSVHDFGQDHNRPYIVMEYVSGEDLRSLLDRGRLSVPQIVDFAIQICEGVAVAHRRSMVHGDLKPGNILISPENKAKVTDFGLARALGESAMDDGELVWGTPAYFAPEQAAGDRVSPATDVYAIGVMLYEMLADTVPFLGDNDQEIARKQLYEQPAPLTSHTQRVPARLEAIVHKALMKEPKERFHSADQLREALIQFKREVRGITSLNPSVQSQAPTASSPIDLATITLGLIALLAVLGLIPLWTQVYRVYGNQGPTVSAPSPLPPLGTGQVRMPSLQGLSEVEAKNILQNVDLNMEINGYEAHPGLKAFSVVWQSIPASTPVTAGDTVYITLSQGQDHIEMPSVVGLTAQQAEETLQAAGLLTQIREVWSTNPTGLVASQEPPPNSLIALQSVASLHINGGTKVKAGANFGDQIMLASYELPRLRFSRNEVIPVTLFWEILEPPQENYEVLIEITTSEGHVVAQYRGNASENQQAQRRWLISTEITDPYQLIVPTSISPGQYQLRLELVNPGNQESLTLISPGTLKSVISSVILQEIQVN